MSKVFLSYNLKNVDFVNELYQKLSRDGVNCFFDKESIEWGSNWVVELEKELDESGLILLILSPDFCKSEWTELERTRVMADDPAGFKKRIKALLLESCGNLLPRFLKPIQHIDIATPEKFEKMYAEICHSLGGTVMEKIGTADRNKLPEICRLPDKHRMPYRSLGRGFIGRVEDLWKINDILVNRKTAVIEGVGVIIGTGGLGKTQMAIEYVHRFGVNYPGGVFWIDADQGLSAMINQISTAADINIDAALKDKEQLSQIWNTLSSYQSALIVLDNFLENEPLQPWLPPESSIYVLVTSRRRDLKASHISLGFMNVTEGIQLLNSGDRQFGQEAGELIEKLGGLPLALELARNFLNLRTDLDIAGLLEEIKKVGEISALNVFADKYVDELPTGHVKEIAATFQISWDMASSTARDVLQAMSLLAPKAVPRRLIRKILSLSDENTLEDRFSDAISELSKKLSMVELDEDDDPWIHRLILGFVRTTINKESGIYEKVVEAVLDEMQRLCDVSDTSSYNQLEKIVPHADSLLSSDFIAHTKAVDISSYIGWHYKKWGKYRLAEHYRRRSLNIAEKNFEPGHPNIAIRQSNLALVLQSLKKPVTFLRRPMNLI